MLIHALDLRVNPVPGPAPPELEVRTIGLPPEVWKRFKSTLVVAPAPAGETPGDLSVRYRFGANDAIALRARPRISVGPNNYPVMIHLRDPGRQSQPRKGVPFRDLWRTGRHQSAKGVARPTGPFRNLSDREKSLDPPVAGGWKLPAMREEL